MTKRRVFVTVTMVVVAVLLAAAIAAAGGVAGYVIARRSLARGVPWRVHQHERQLLPPFLQPPPAIGREFTILTSGAQVTWVEKGSPAGEAGIKAGDIITAVDDQGIDGDHPLRDLISGHESGEKVTLTLNRGGESKEIELTLGETTDEAGKTGPYLGIRYRSIERPRFFQREQSDQSQPLQPKLSLLDGLRSPS